MTIYISGSIIKFERLLIMAVTLQEIADKIGVSKMTVSRVLNGKSRGQVSSVLAEKIKAALAEHDYQPNQNARNLRSLRNSVQETTAGKTINILLPCPDFLDRHPDVIAEYVELSNGVLQTATKYDFSIKMLPISQNNDPYNIEWNWLKDLGHNSCVLAYSAWFMPVLTELSHRGCRIAMISPEIFWRTAYENIVKDWALFTYMTVDASMQLTEHLFDEGYSKIAVAAGYPDEPDQPLVLGYNNVMEKHKNTYRNIIRLEKTDNKTVFKMICDAYEQNPFDSLILEYSNYWQVNYQYSLQKNIGLPENVKIIFRENCNASMNFNPQITSIRYPRKKMGSDAAERLLAEEFLPGEKFYQGKLQIRGNKE